MLGLFLKHIHETVPREYQKGIYTISRVLKKAWEIANSTSDEKVRLHALVLIDQCNIHRMDMATGGNIITDALKYVTAKTEKLKNSVSTAALEEEEEEEEEKTTNDVF
jgi:hypothetical protein